MNAPHVPGCTGKRKFATEALALTHGSPRWQRGKKVDQRRAYQCGACGCWHLTSWTAARQAQAMETVNGRARHDERKGGAA